MIGQRILFLEPPHVTAWWRQNSPGIWFPSYGMQGTIIAYPAPGLIGSGPQIRWANGRVTWLGSASQYKIIT
jgi:hypothetical protein